MNNRFELEDSQEEKWFEAVILGFDATWKM